jgi:transmembrane sensor
MGDFFNRYLRNKCSIEDLPLVIKLFTSRDKQKQLEERMKEHWDEKDERISTPDLDSALYKIHYQINTQEQKTIGFRWVRFITRTAAILSIPLALALGYQLYNKDQTIQLKQTISAPLASRTSFNLPDGSKVWLNAGSSLTFENNYGKESRHVLLSGQAYFDVKKDKIPFEVQTYRFNVRVFGTAFDVLAYPNEESAVTLEHGKVEVDTNTGFKAELHPGERADMNEDATRINTKMVDSRKFVSWKDNRLIFVDEPLQKVAACLERWYNLKIEIEDESIKNLKVNGTIEYESINEVLDLLSLAGRISYTFDKDNRQLKLKAK